MKIFQLLLMTLPSSFRSEFGDEILDIYEMERRTVDSPLGLVILGLKTAVDILRNAVLVHFDLLRLDLRQARRSFARAPTFALSVIIITALGIGANTTVFSVADQVLLRPLPYPDSERLVKLWESTPSYSAMEASPPNYRDWRSRLTSYSSISGYHGFAANLTTEISSLADGLAQPQRVRGIAMVPDLTQTLHIRPLLGRNLEPADAAEDAEPTVVISHRLWQGAFGASADVVGQRITLDEEVTTVVGVMPRTFAFPSARTDLWRPLSLTAGPGTENRDDNFLEVLAKLAPGVTLDQARAEAQTVAAALEAQYPESNAETTINVVRLRDEMPNQTRTLLWALLAASASVLLIACANLANLLLARALGRQKEIVLRTALGAGQDRLIRQLLTESGVLTLAGAVLGMFMAWLSVPLLHDLVPSRLPLAATSALEPRVLAFTTVVTAATTLVFGVIPALYLRTSSQAASLLQTRSATSTRKGLRRTLVVGEVGLAVGLLSVCLLLLGALTRVQSTAPGFEVRNAYTVETPLSMPQYETTASRLRFYDQVVSEVESLPGVESAGFASFLPMVMGGGVWPVGVPGQDPDTSDRRASLRFVTAGYFDAMDIPLVMGRWTEQRDSQDAPPVAVVSQSFVKQFFPEVSASGRSPLGLAFDFGFQKRSIIGVAGDVKVRGLERSSEPQVYLPAAQVPDGALTFYAPRHLVMRSKAGLDEISAPIHQILRSADPALPIVNLRPLSEIVRNNTAPRRAQLSILGPFALLALLLAALGIHGLLSFSVAQRRSEVGVRLALGARRSNVMALFMREAGWLYLAGSLLGLAIAWAAGRWIESTLAGVDPLDGTALGIAVALAGLTTLASSLFPALRASRVDPVESLQGE